MINSSNINPKAFAQYDHQITDNQCNKEELNPSCYDLATEQAKGKEPLQIKELQCGKPCQAFNRKHILLNDLLYYLSKADSDTVICFYIPHQLRKEVTEQYLDTNGHMEIEKTNDTIKQNTTGQTCTKIYINM